MHILVVTANELILLKHHLLLLLLLVLIYGVRWENHLPATRLTYDTDTCLQLLLHVLVAHQGLFIKGLLRLHADLGVIAATGGLGLKGHGRLVLVIGQHVLKWTSTGGDELALSLVVSLDRVWASTSDQTSVSATGQVARCDSIL